MLSVVTFRKILGGEADMLLAKLGIRIRQEQLGLKTRVIRQYFYDTVASLTSSPDKRFLPASRNSLLHL